MVTGIAGITVRQATDGAALPMPAVAALAG